MQALYAITIGTLLFAVCADIAARLIPNWIVLAVVALGAGSHVLRGTLAPAATIAAVVFVVAVLAWRLKVIGGGDAKLLAASALAVPVGAVGTFLTGTALAGGVLALFYLLLSVLVRAPGAIRPRRRLLRIWRIERWRIRRRASLPYASAIAAGAILAFIQG